MDRMKTVIVNAWEGTFKVEAPYYTRRQFIIEFIASELGQMGLHNVEYITESNSAFYDIVNRNDDMEEQLEGTGFIQELIYE